MSLVRDWLRWALAWLTPIWLIALFRVYCLHCDASGWRWHHNGCHCLVVVGEPGTPLHDALSRLTARDTRDG